MTRRPERVDGTHSRDARLAVALTVGAGVVVAAAMALTLLGGSDGDRQQHLGGPSATFSVTTPPDGPATAVGDIADLIPKRGAFVGAAVQARTGGDEARVGAVTDFEKAVGRQVDLVHVYSQIDDDWPRASDLALMQDGRRLLLSWNGMDMQAVADGSQDGLIRERARSMLKVPGPFWLMFRGEMDRPNLRKSVPTPEVYVAAWKHTREIFDEVGVTNAAWVWCPTSKAFTEGRAAAYYPGDSEVDWTCSDVYPGPDLQPFTVAAKEFIAFTNAHHHPAMVGEFGLAERDGQRAQWLSAAAAAIRATPSIKAVAYFNGNNDAKGARAQLSLLGFADSVNAFHDILATPSFNTSNLPLSPAKP
ncbi:glycosyl hydrolase [Angustibacter sp. McL0619]|uniref:glycosyl hydrolase n=1 Tax=Angustibacter sp. McL0619 TaxID=3415676 RepID=UPI003CF5F1B4